MKTAFVYSGQGTQHVGMAHDLYTRFPQVRKRFDFADRHLGGGLLKAMFEDGETLKTTAYAQPAIYTMSAALRDLLHAEGWESAGTAGLSLGEYAAFYDAGVFNFENGFDIVAARGIFMTRSAARSQTMLGALIGDFGSVDAMLGHYPDCYVANRNLKTQTVVGGPRKMIMKLMKDIRNFGIKRAVPLAVEGAFHTPHMIDAERAFNDYIRDIAIHAPAKPLYLNIDGRVCQRAPKSEMVAQMTRPVRFHDMIETMIQDGFDPFVEIGPGTVLSGLIRKIDSNVTVLNIENVESFETSIECLKEMSQP